MPNVSFISFNQPKKVRCECCGRTTVVEVKMFVAEQGRLAGDLDLCTPCAQLLKQALAGEEVVQEWNFGAGGENLG